MDVFVKHGDTRLAIELKYHQKALAITHSGEAFDLSNQGAHPVTRYHFAEDVARIEAFVANGAATDAWAIFLTNDPLFWKPDAKGTGIDRTFLMHEGARISGTLAWTEGSATGLRKSVAQRITLCGQYDLRWHDFSELGEGPAAKFRYTFAVAQKTGVDRHHE
ncbi:MAG: hypothetical protein ACYCX6_00010 [Vulcanimicrobiaceae bacterium]